MNTGTWLVVYALGPSAQYVRSEPGYGNVAAVVGEIIYEKGQRLVRALDGSKQSFEEAVKVPAIERLPKK